MVVMGMSGNSFSMKSQVGISTLYSANVLRSGSLHCTLLHQFPTFHHPFNTKCRAESRIKTLFSFIIYFQGKILMKDLNNNTYHSWIF